MSRKDSLILLSVCTVLSLTTGITACEDPTEEICYWRCISSNGDTFETETASEGSCSKKTVLYQGKVRYVCDLKVAKICPADLDESPNDGFCEL